MNECVDRDKATDVEMYLWMNGWMDERIDG